MESSDMSDSEKVTLKINSPTKRMLEAFQSNHYRRTGKRLNNDEAVALAIEIADPEAVELVDMLFGQEPNGDAEKQSRK
jgi:hypothetical protein